MNIAIVYLFLLAHVVLHEYWHVRAMRGAGVRVVEAGLGLPLPPKFTHTDRRGFRWTISPWLVGAYVQPHHDDWKKIEKAPYAQAAWQFNAGIAINLITGLLAAGAAALLRGRPVAGTLMLAGGILCLLAQKKIAVYLIPAIGPAALAFFAWSFVDTVNTGGSAGLTGIATLAPAHLSLTALLNLYGALGLALALLNAVPLAPMDNGRVWDRLLTDWFGPKVARATFSVGFGLIGAVTVYALGSDLVAVLT